MIQTDLTKDEIEKREKERLLLLSEVVRLRRFIEREHEETSKYKKLSEDQRARLLEANRKISNYRKLFEIMKVDMEGIDQ